MRADPQIRPEDSVNQICHNILSLWLAGKGILFLYNPHNMICQLILTTFIQDPFAGPYSTQIYLKPFMNLPLIDRPKPFLSYIDHRNENQKDRVCLNTFTLSMKAGFLDFTQIFQEIPSQTLFS